MDRLEFWRGRSRRPEPSNQVRGIMDMTLRENSEGEPVWIYF